MVGRLFGRGMPRSIVPVAVLALGLLFPVTASATGLGSPTSNQGNIGVQVGYLKATDADDGNYLVGGHLELHLASFLGLRADVSRRTEEMYKFRAEGNDLSMEVQTIPITASARLYAPIPIGIVPYALGGAGWYRMEYTFSEDARNLFDVSDHTETTFGWHVGGGALMSLGPRLAVFGEYRAIFTDPDGDLNDEVQQAIEDLDFDSSNVIAGVSVYF